MLEIFGVQLRLVPSTSPVPGMRAASLVDASGAVRPNLFSWDPLGQIVHYEQDALYALVHDVKKSKAGVSLAVLWVTDFAIRLIKGLRSLFGGSYGGSFGFGSLGGMMAAISAVLFILASITAAAVITPLAILAWVLRYRIDREISVESQKVLSQVSEYFAEQEATPAAVGR